MLVWHNRSESLSNILFTLKIYIFRCAHWPISSVLCCIYVYEKQRDKFIHVAFTMLPNGYWHIDTFQNCMCSIWCGSVRHIAKRFDHRREPWIGVPAGASAIIECEMDDENEVRPIRNGGWQPKHEDGWRLYAWFDIYENAKWLKKRTKVPIFLKIIFKVIFN